MLEINNLFFGYSKENVLKDVSLTALPGKITTIIGPNGCGKSTLLKTIINPLSNFKGEIKINGISKKDMPKKDIAKKVSYLSQGKNIPDITVGRMVLHGRFPYLSYPRKYKKSDFDIADNAMKKMNIYNLKYDNMTTLSGGMRQRVYIAMALCQGADIIMLDEPNTYLDISNQFKLLKILKELTKENKTVLNVSHDIISSLKFSDEIIVINEGTVKEKGTPSQIIESGIIPRIFNINISSVLNNDRIEYFYSEKEQIK